MKHLRKAHKKSERDALRGAGGFPQYRGVLARAGAISPSGGGAVLIVAAAVVGQAYKDRPRPSGRGLFLGRFRAWEIIESWMCPPTLTGGH